MIVRTRVTVGAAGTDEKPNRTAGTTGATAPRSADPHSARTAVIACWSLATYHSRLPCPAVPRVRTPSRSRRANGSAAVATSGRDRVLARHRHQQAAEARARADREVRRQRAGAQTPATSPLVRPQPDRHHVHRVERVGPGHEVRDVVAGSQQHAQPVGALDHHVGEGAERRRAPPPHDDARALGGAEPGDVTVEGQALGCGAGRARHSSCPSRRAYPPMAGRIAVQGQRHHAAARPALREEPQKRTGCAAATVGSSTGSPAEARLPAG